MIRDNGTHNEYSPGGPVHLAGLLRDDVVDDADGTRVFSIDPELARSRWNNLGVISDAIAASQVSPLSGRHSFVALSMALNELLERAISRTSTSMPVTVRVRRRERRVFFSVTYSITRNEWLSLKEDFGAVCSPDLSSLYVDKISKSAITGDASGLDLIMLKKDFSANISISALEDDEEVLWMTVEADMPL